MKGVMKRDPADVSGDMHCDIFCTFLCCTALANSIKAPLLILAAQRRMHEVKCFCSFFVCVNLTFYDHGNY